MRIAKIISNAFHGFRSSFFAMPSSHKRTQKIGQLVLIFTIWLAGTRQPIFRRYDYAPTPVIGCNTAWLRSRIFNALLSAKLSKLPNLTRQSEIMLTTIRYRVKKKFSAEECRSVALRLE